MSLTELYRKRLAFDARRQPSYFGLLSEFDQKLQKMERLHPYELRTEDRRGLGGAFSGLPARVEERFLFRLNGLASLLRRKDGLELLTQHAPDEVFREARRKHLWKVRQEPQSGGWLPLSDYVRGKLQGLRGIDFWTDFPLLPLNLRESAYRIGLPRDYHPEDPLVLRCPASVFGEGQLPLRVPSVLDGYDHGPFLAMADCQSPTAGFTIDLNEGPQRLRLGVREFVTSDLPVEMIEFIPVDWQLIPAPERRLVDNPELALGLVSFLAQETE